MELELKHLSAYLPYGLNGQLVGYPQGTTVQMGLHLSNTNKIWTIDMFFPYNGVQKVKPLLHPLSKLDIVIRNEFEKYNGLAHGKHDEEIINLFCEENGIDEIISNMAITSLPYECVEYMFKNHYDVFSLIPAGLAEEIK